ncbi:hypothetical protein JI57_03890 [Psychromonas sp. PRT-SC03]|nr:hypothetical protein JI57_03890 [Psychromonas sp. PRT-SC03]
MFKSEPICILTAGPTVDGRFIAQSVIDDIAELYNPKTYNARINEGHWSWGDKYGSVLSVEKRDTELWAVLKPNSLLLSTIEQGQLLHTSCEITPDFAKTGKSYLTGLALTDEPASLGTTEIHLSKVPVDKDKIMLCSGATLTEDILAKKGLGKEPLEKDTELPAIESVQDDPNFINKLKQLLGIKTDTSEKRDQEETEMEKEMEKELKALLEKNTKQAETLNATLITLTASVGLLSAQNKADEVPAGDELAAKDKAEGDAGATDLLSTKFDALSGKFDELVVTLGKMTDENPRSLAGSEGGEGYL